MRNIAKISYDPIQEHMSIVNNTIETSHYQQVLAKNIAYNLKTTKVKTPYFYITPKVQKKDGPIVSSFDCQTSILFKFVDRYADDLPPSVKNTKDFINKLTNVTDTSKDSILVILDVRALYTNIPNHEGIEVDYNSRISSVCEREER